MQRYEPLSTSKSSAQAQPDLFRSGEKMPFRDNRPGATVQLQLQEMAANNPYYHGVMQLQTIADAHVERSSPLEGVIQLQKTISGHGKLKRAPKTKKISRFKVPKKKTVVISVPPGATLGNISMILNKTDNPDFVDLRKKIKVSTTSEFWGNKRLVERVHKEASINKTVNQQSAINKILKAPGAVILNKSEKLSLVALERKKEFESWAMNLILPLTFVEYPEGTMVQNMELSEFEPALKSKTNAAQNEYVGNDLELSDYVKKSSEDKIIVNACSYDANAEFTGLQVDKK